MKHKNLDPNILYPVGTRVWCNGKEGIIKCNNYTKDYPYRIAFLENTDLTITFSKSGLYYKEASIPSLLLLEENPLL